MLTTFSGTVGGQLRQVLLYNYLVYTRNTEKLENNGSNDSATPTVFCIPLQRLAQRSVFPFNELHNTNVP
jgi:hypothetical protein